MDNGNLEIGPDQLFFRIGQVCRLTDIKPFTLRYWETEFPVLQPVKSSKGHRLYRREDVQTVLRIKRLLYDEGFTIAGARRYLRDADPAAPPQEALPQTALAAMPVGTPAAMPLGMPFGTEDQPERESARAPQPAERSEARSETGAARSSEAPAPKFADAANLLSRKLLLDLRDSLRAFLTLLENE